MKKRLMTTCVAFLLLSLAAATTEAQAPRGVAAGVGIVDLSYIFKHHNRFKEQTDAMRAEVQQRQTYFEQKQSSFRSSAEGLKRFKPGSPEFKQLEAQLTTEKAQLEAEVTLQKKEFLEREATLYYTAYREILDEVRMHCQRNNILLVLRFNGDPVENPTPKEVMKQLNKAVLYNHRDIDITPIILRSINEQRGQPGNFQPPNVSGRPRPGQAPRRR